jgi:hypothetical protein
MAARAAGGGQNTQGLVKVPIGPTNTQYATGVNGTASVALAYAVTNTDGLQEVVNMTVPAVTAGAVSNAWLEQTVYGRRVGVRFRRNNSAALPPFTVYIDGIPYAVRRTGNRRHAATLLSSSDFEGLFLLADDLGDGPHTVRVSVAGDEIGGISRTLILHGWLLEKSAGYEESSRAGALPPSPTVLGTTATVVPATGNRGLVRKLYFHNTDVATRVVTLSLGATNIFKVISLPAGTSQDVDFNGTIQVGTSDFRWKADAAAVVNAYAMEVV